MRWLSSTAVALTRYECAKSPRVRSSNIIFWSPPMITSSLKIQSKHVLIIIIIEVNWQTRGKECSGRTPGKMSMRTIIEWRGCAHSVHGNYAIPPHESLLSDGRCRIPWAKINSYPPHEIPLHLEFLPCSVSRRIPSLSDSVIENHKTYLYWL